MNDNPFGSWPSTDGAGNPFEQTLVFPDLGSEANMPDPFAQPTEALNASVTTPQPPQPIPATQTTPDTPPQAEGEQLQLLGMPPPAEAKAEPGADTVYALPPVFEHGSVTEDITDLNQTFDELRTAKADDFPELEDGNRVTWDVTYGKIRKTV
jgi:hypothetical protein